jgi:uncharacterized protein YggE
MKRFLPSLLLLPILAFGQGGLPDKPYIYVVGKAAIEKKPDYLTLSFDLVGRAPDQPKANAEVQASAAKVFGLLKAKKIADTDVIAEDIRSEPDFEAAESYPLRRGKLIGYVVTRPFVVKLRDITVLPKLVDELAAVGNVEFTRIEPGLSKEKELVQQLWDKAVADAREQAEKTLKQIVMKMDSVFAVSPVPFPEIQTKIFGETERVIVTGSNIPTKPGEVAAEYRLAPVSISQTVHVIYLISPIK